MKTNTITEITIGETAYQVIDMPAEVQEMVATFNEWNVMHAEALDKSHILQAAKDNLSSRIIGMVKADLEAGQPEAVPEIIVPK